MGHVGMSAEVRVRFPKSPWREEVTAVGHAAKLLTLLILTGCAGGRGGEFLMEGKT